MAFTAPKEVYNGKINSVTIGKGESAIEIGGSEVFPRYSFDGNAGKSVAAALEVWDVAPTDWADSLNNVYGSVYANPVDWALLCQDELGAQAICLRLQGTHPDQDNRSPEEAAGTVREILEAIKVPLIIVGANHIEKDAEVIKACAEAAAGYHCLIGKAQEKNHKTIAASAIGYGHVLLALSNLDINLAKQLNILLTQMGVQANNIVMDPMASALGYGLDYCYSVMERIRNAALKQNDAMVQMPMVGDLGYEAWKAKEAKLAQEENPAWGDAELRGQSWEAITAVSMVMAGADLLIMRHPEAVKAVKNCLNDLNS